MLSEVSNLYFVFVFCFLFLEMRTLVTEGGSATILRLSSAIRPTAHLLPSGFAYELNAALKIRLQHPAHSELREPPCTRDAKVTTCWPSRSSVTTPRAFRKRRGRGTGSDDTYRSVNRKPGILALICCWSTIAALPVSFIYFYCMSSPGGNLHVTQSAARKQSRVIFRLNKS
ncbi:hypothetical protein B0F90DRAFT_1747691 [Multifurca ochricompacta]|uniref:Uncharacterized protein n=1 Tax=Multifurca ochricompacta TaxID=376703 RepID=A0AAD4QIL8_9AGAM|nr:hypothetical protein B0F90DRAFT_1747691 [Multifurca ochricompacta]